MTTFLLFSFLSGVLELGTVLRYFNEGYPLWNIFLMASMYQLGNLLFLGRDFLFERCDDTLLLLDAAVVLRHGRTNREQQQEGQQNTERFHRRVISFWRIPRAGR